MFRASSSVALAKDWEDENCSRRGTRRAPLSKRRWMNSTKSGWMASRRSTDTESHSAIGYSVPLTTTSSAKAIAGVVYGHIEGGQPKSVQEFEPPDTASSKPTVFSPSLAMKLLRRDQIVTIRSFRYRRPRISTNAYTQSANRCIRVSIATTGHE